MKTKTKRKKLPIIVGIILTAVAGIAAFVSVVSSTNVKAMNQTVDAVLSEIRKTHTMTPIDCGEYKNLKLYGILKFKVEQYDIEEVGNLSIMRVNMGVMQMATVVITPKDKNLPLFSADYMYILSNRKAYIEFYDVVKEKDEVYVELLTNLSNIQENYKDLEDFAVEPAWYESLLSVKSYKSGTKEQDEILKNNLVDNMNVYLEHAKELPVLSEADQQEKLAITLDYTNGLVDRGGVSTDVFKSALGVEETKKFFAQVFFGTAIE